jgi:hypothetical protein
MSDRYTLHDDQSGEENTFATLVEMEDHVRNVAFASFTSNGDTYEARDTETAKTWNYERFQSDTDQRPDLRRDDGEPMLHTAIETAITDNEGSIINDMLDTSPAAPEDVRNKGSLVVEGFTVPVPYKVYAVARSEETATFYALTDEQEEAVDELIENDTASDELMAIGALNPAPELFSSWPEVMVFVTGSNGYVSDVDAIIGY